MTQVMPPDVDVLDRETGQFYCPVLGVKPTGYDQAREAETAELERERVRLWYVAATRARELLILPSLDVQAKDSAWSSLVELSLADLPRIELAEAVEPAASDDAVVNGQTRQVFAAEARSMADSQRRLEWRAPSRDEPVGDQAAAPEIYQAPEPGLFIDEGGQFPGLELTSSAIQGGRERGTILHKLLEEVLTGETDEAAAALYARATELIRSLGRVVEKDPARGLSAFELAACVERTLAIPEVVALRPRLEPEFPVFASHRDGLAELVTAGVADAIARNAAGHIDVVVD
jgi:exodeoxyribonuclease-5